MLRSVCAQAGQKRAVRKFRTDSGSLSRYSEAIPSHIVKLARKKGYLLTARPHELLDVLCENVYLNIYPSA
jgi:hypothetical protein